jgi:hypothetical protein
VFPSSTLLPNEVSSGVKLRIFPTRWRSDDNEEEEEEVNGPLEIGVLLTLALRNGLDRMREGGVGSCTVGVLLMDVGGVDDVVVVVGRCAKMLDVSSSLPLFSSGGGALRLYLGEGSFNVKLLLPVV